MTLKEKHLQKWNALNNRLYDMKLPRSLHENFFIVICNYRQYSKKNARALEDFHMILNGIYYAREEWKRNGIQDRWNDR